jgi:hypothetical protein
VRRSEDALGLESWATELERRRARPLQLPWRSRNCRVPGSDPSSMSPDVIQSNVGVTQVADSVVQSGLRSLDDGVGSEMVVGESLNYDAELMLVSE